MNCQVLLDIRRNQEAKVILRGLMEGFGKEGVFETWSKPRVLAGLPGLPPGVTEGLPCLLVFLKL